MTEGADKSFAQAWAEREAQGFGTTDAEFQRAKKNARMAAALIAAYYNQLRGDGVPEEYAQFMTQDFAAVLHDGIGTGIKLHRTLSSFQGDAEQP